VSAALAARRAHRGDEGWWREQIDAACGAGDPVMRNLLITLGHYELSLALREVIGPDAGANFHTWAVWGSKKAGTTIRGEDVSGCGAVVIRVGGRRVLARAAAQVLAGNITVLDDIGRVSARFACAFARENAPDQERLEAFLDGLEPGPPEAGGQDLLRDAFREYWRARHQPDANMRHEQVLLGNLKAILHEHVRLEPYIGGAIPRPLRRVVTARLLDFRAGAEQLRVNRDVPPREDPRDPLSLRHLTNPDLVAFLTGPAGWDRTPDSHDASRARDWADLRDRMNYICDLFRSRHFEEQLFASPYSDAQWRALLAGRVPAPPL
jgi:hypothetical protein